MGHFQCLTAPQWALGRSSHMFKILWTKFEQKSIVTSILEELPQVS